MTSKLLDVTLVRTPDQLTHVGQLLNDAIKDHAYIAVDIETPSQLSPYNEGATILMIGICWDVNHAYVIPYEHPDSALPRLSVHTFLTDYLPRIRFVGQNTKFEVNWFATRGIVLSPSIDTMLLSHYVDERSPANLDSISQRLFDAPPYGDGIDYTHEPLESYARYCGLDWLYTLQAANKWEPYSHDTYYKFIMEISSAVAVMERQGFTLDVERTGKLEQDLLQEETEQLARLPSSKKVNFNSPKQVAEWFIKQGVPLTETTPTGSLSVGKDALLYLQDYPLVAQYQNWKRTHELVKKFTSKWPAFVGTDGKVRASYFPLTETGRHRCSNPNIQQVPRDKRLRSCWVTSSPEYELVSWDVSQVELRMAAAIAPERRMAQLFSEKTDIHTATATSLVGRPPSDEERTYAKYINFGFLYGMGAPKFQQQVLKAYGRRVTLDEARNARKTYFDTYPGLSSWHDNVLRQVLHDGYVRSIFGRTRHLPEALSPDPQISAHAQRSAINFLVQSPAADITHAALVVAKTWELPIVATIHDSVLWEQPKGTGDTYAQRLLPAAMQILRDIFDWESEVPFEADWKIGEYWL